MTEILLNAVINVFASLAAALDEDGRAGVRRVLERYLRDHLRLGDVSEYLGLFDLALDMHAAAGDARKLAQQAGDIAARLRTRLALDEQHVFLLRLVEAAADRFAQGEPLVRAAADKLAPQEGVVDDLVALCRFTGGALHEPQGGVRLVHLAPDGFSGELAALRPEGCAVTFAAGSGDGLTLDGSALAPGSPRVLPPGAIIRDARGSRVYEADISRALDGRAGQGSLSFTGRGLDFRYPGSDNGLHDFSFSLAGGMMVGVMGVSGAGKSTLLSILNGQQRPDAGSLTVNGVDLHREPERLEGVIGYVPQDDLLFEELSVFDNLSCNAALCMAHLDADERARRVDALLDELNQLSIRDLKVGSPLEKTISGGQRKRLNIALELLREPSILFVDEPTSGLSSADSENVMALLKAQALKGRLVVVVIHQPSSAIYKMFDRLWIMDVGGRPIYDGNPLDAIVHFRSEVFRAGMDEYACARCGHVNPEQLFEIIEARTIDENGGYTRERLISPEQWHRRHLQQRPEPDPPQEASAVERRLWRPGWFGQFRVFFMRTLKGRLANGQYLLINLLEPPVLALLAALISHGAWGAEYSLADNANLSTYFFISVIVSLFLGLSVSAEEINRDRKILRREEFLNLSWSGYVTAKTAYLLAVAALQTVCFVLVGNTVLGVENMAWPAMLVLFSCAAASSLLGLNISASFRSAVTIYILIPLLLVPQMMLGGAVVPFDDLLHREAGHGRTPLVADLMPARWGYEALLVEQYLENDYNRRFMPWELERLQNAYMAGNHVPEMHALADYPLIEDNARERPEETARRLAALAAELERVRALTGLECGPDRELLTLGRYDAEVRAEVKTCLREAGREFGRRRDEAFDRIREIREKLREELGRDGLDELRRDHFNREIATRVTNSLAMNPVRLSGERLVQVASPISREPESAWGGAQFLAAHKRLGDRLVDTFHFNVAVLWSMALALYAALWLRLLPRAFDAFGRLVRKRIRRKASN